jgi:NitT/TauT family transport system permease protein
MTAGSVPVQPDARSWVRLPGRASWLWAALSFVALLVAWEVAARLDLISRLFFSSPTEVLATAIDEVQNGRFWRDLGISTIEFWAGFAAAAAPAVPLGLAVGSSRRLGHLVAPWLDGLNATPRIALLPLIVLWVGLGFWAAVFIVYLGAFFSIAINTSNGVKTVDPRLKNVARSFGASRMRRFFTITLPATVPYTIAGLKIGVGRALIGVFVAEIFGGTAGIGYMIKLAGQTLQTDRVFFGVAVFIVMGVALFALISALERRFERWRPKAFQP